MEISSQHQVYLEDLAITQLFEWDARNTKSRDAMTLELINIDPWNAVNLALPENAPVAFLKQVREAALLPGDASREVFRGAGRGPDTGRILR